MGYIPFSDRVNSSEYKCRLAGWEVSIEIERMWKWDAVAKQADEESDTVLLKAAKNTYIETAVAEGQ